MGSSISVNWLKEKKWIPELLLYVFAAECVFGGSGRWLCIGSLSIRILLFILCFAASLPFVFLEQGVIFRKTCIIFSAVFGLFLLIGAFVGLKSGNTVSFIWADISSFLTLALLPGIFAVIDNDQKLNRLLNVIFYSSVFVAVMTTVLHIGLAWMDDTTINILNDWINEKSLGGFAILATRLNRVYFRSQIFLQFSVLLGIWKIWKINDLRQRVLLFVCEGTMIFAIIASYTRGFWIGLFFSFVIVVGLEWKKWKSLLKTVCIFLLMVVAFFCISTICYGKPYVLAEVINRFDSNLIVLRASEENSEVPVETIVETSIPSSEKSEENEKTDIVAASNETAVNLRKDSLAALNKKIAAHPILGNGLGTNLDGVRNDGKTEYMYQDIMMKLGGIGLLLFLVVFLCMPLIHIYKRIRCIHSVYSWDDNRVRNSFLVAGYLGVALTSAFNPFLASPMGIMMLIVVDLSVTQSE